MVGAGPACPPRLRVDAGARGPTGSSARRRPRRRPRRGRPSSVGSSTAGPVRGPSAVSPSSTRGEGVLDRVRQDAGGAGAGDATSTMPAPVAAWATAPAESDLGEEGGEEHGETSPLPDPGSARRRAPADLAVRADGLGWSTRRPVASSSASAAFGRPGWVAVARTASVKAARPAPPSGAGRPARSGLEGLLDGAVVGCCGHLAPVIAGAAGKGCAAAPTLSGEPCSSCVPQRPQPAPLERLDRAPPSGP